MLMPTSKEEEKENFSLLPSTAKERNSSLLEGGNKSSTSLEEKKELPDIGEIRICLLVIRGKEISDRSLTLIKLNRAQLHDRVLHILTGHPLLLGTWGEGGFEPKFNRELFIKLFKNTYQVKQFREHIIEKNNKEVKIVILYAKTWDFCKVRKEDTREFFRQYLMKEEEHREFMAALKKDKNSMSIFIGNCNGFRQFILNYECNKKNIVFRFEGRVLC